MRAAHIKSVGFSLWGVTADCLIKVIFLQLRPTLILNLTIRCMYSHSWHFLPSYRFRLGFTPSVSWTVPHLYTQLVPLIPRLEVCIGILVKCLRRCQGWTIQRIKDFNVPQSDLTHTLLCRDEAADSVSVSPLVRCIPPHSPLLL